MHVDGPFVLLQRVVVAHELEELAPGVDPARAACQVSEEVELGGRKRDAVAVARHSTAVEVDDQIAATQQAPGS